MLLVGPSLLMGSDRFCVNVVLLVRQGQKRPDLVSGF